MNLDNWLFVLAIILRVIISSGGCEYERALSIQGNGVKREKKISNEIKMGNEGQESCLLLVKRNSLFVVW